MNRSSVSTLEDEVSYEELFSVFDSAQSYFMGTQDQAFNETLSKSNQLSMEIRKNVTCNTQLKRKNAAKLSSLEERLADVSKRTEGLRARLQTGEHTNADLESTLTSYRGTFKELKTRLLESAGENARKEMEYSEAIRILTERPIYRITHKSSTSKHDLLMLFSAPDQSCEDVEME